MKYRNKATGQVIKTTGVVDSPDWELVGKDKPPKKGAGSKQEEQDAE